MNTTQRKNVAPKNITLKFPHFIRQNGQVKSSVTGKKESIIKYLNSSKIKGNGSRAKKVSLNNKFQHVMEN
jgi:hypothetical protein